MARNKVGVKQCDMYKCYSYPLTIKAIIWWDIFKVLLPIFLFIVYLLVAVDEDSGEASNGEGIDSSMLTPSPGEGSSDISDQLTVLSLLIGEIIRAMMIVTVGVIAYCRKFAILPTGTYFWTRVINSMINIISHMFMFLILGANIFTLIVTTGMFSLDVYLNFIIWYFWQLPKRNRLSSLSNSDFSQALSVDDVVGGVVAAHPAKELKSLQEAKRRDIQNNSISKEVEVPVRLKLDSDDESAAIEESKNVEEKYKLPNISGRRGKLTMF